MRLPSSVGALIAPLCAAGLVVAGTGAVVTARAADVPFTGRVVGGNHAVNEGATDPLDISAHNSVTVVQSPVDPDQLAISNRIDSPQFSCALHVSDDGGSTWDQTPLPVPKGEEPKCYAPEVAFSADGKLYLAFVTLKGIGNVPNAVWIVSSDDGGTTLSKPLQALGQLAFQVRLRTDPEQADRLYLTWLQAQETATLAFPTPGNPIRWASSDDGGASWSRPVTVNDPGRVRVVAPTPEVGTDGRAWALYLDLQEDRLDYEGAHGGLGGPPYPDHWSLVLARSTDAGATWDETIVDDRIVPTERFVVFIPPFPSLAVDESSDRVYVSFHDGLQGDADVWLWASDDGGRTFSERVRVNDTVLGDDTTQYLPQVQTAPDGRVDVLYYDRRNDPRDLLNETSLQTSIDGGSSFSGRIVLSDHSFDSRVGVGSERGMPTLGSRLGLLSTNTDALSVWTDTRRGTEASSKQDIVRALVVFSQRPPLSASVRTAFSWGGAVLAGAGLLFLGRWLWRTKRRPGATTPQQG